MDDSSSKPEKIEPPPLDLLAPLERVLSLNASYHGHPDGTGEIRIPTPSHTKAIGMLREAREALIALRADRLTAVAAAYEAAAQAADDWFYDPSTDEVIDGRLSQAIRALTPADAAAAGPGAVYEAVRCALLRKVDALDADSAPDPITVAAQDVLAERARQISAEGWTPANDDRHAAGEMAGAAACYAMQVALDHIGRDDLHTTVSRTIRELWPWAANWWKPTGRRRDLVKAGALIIAEIERLDRLKARAKAREAHHG